jgi:hypothetical protein
MYDNTEYAFMSNNQIRERERTARTLRLLDAQQKEITPTMVEFDHETHVLRVENDSYGGITVGVRDRQSGKMLHRVRFPKKPHRTKLGVVYNFRKGDSLCRLFIEPALIAQLEAAAVQHDQYLADKRAARGY